MWTVFGHVLMTVVASAAEAPVSRKKKVIARMAANDGINMASRSRRGFSREVCLNFASSLISEGAGNAGRPMRPQPRCKKKAPELVTGHTGITRHSPRNGFTVYFALSPVTRLV